MKLKAREWFPAEETMKPVVADLVKKRTQYVEKNGTIEVLEGTINGSVSIRKHTVMSEETRAKAVFNRFLFCKKSVDIIARAKL